MRYPTQETLLRWLEVAELCKDIAEGLREKFKSLRWYLKGEEEHLVKYNVKETILDLRWKIGRLQEVAGIASDGLERGEIVIKTRDIYPAVFLLWKIEKEAREYGDSIQSLAISEDTPYKANTQIEIAIHSLTLTFFELLKVLANEDNKHNLTN